MHIIQDFLKISNNNISRTFLVYFSIISALGLGFMIGRMSNIHAQQQIITITDQNGLEVSEVEDINSTTTGESTIQSSKGLKVKSTDKSMIFGSSKGKYFYYKGCGGSTISPKNLVYYKSEQDAVNRGKIIYSKCR